MTEGFYRLGDAVRLIDPEDPTPRPEVRRPDRRRLQARQWHLGQRGPVARGAHRRPGAGRAGCGDRGPRCRFRRGARRFPMSMPARRCSHCPTHADARGARRRSQLLAWIAAAPRRARARQPGQQPLRAPGPRAAGRAVARSWRDHGQGLDQSARGIAASRGPRGRAVFGGAPGACRRHRNGGVAS